MNVLARNVRCVTNIVNNVFLKSHSLVPVTRTAGFKSDLKIKWVRPPAISVTAPEKSGDGGLDLKITQGDLSNYFDNSKELEDADPIVKKMFTLEFMPRKETQNKKREKTLELVKRHAADRGSIESRLAAMTSEILDLQEYLQQHPRNKQTKHFLKELIDRRKKYLSKLRKMDYRKFEWILEKLNLVFKPHPEDTYLPVTRKRSMRKLTEIHCNKLKIAKLQAYQKELHMQQKRFFVEKAQKLEFIRNEEIACGAEPTVSEEDIAIAKKQAASVK